MGLLGLLRRKERGQALVEFAVTLSILLLLILGGAEMTRLIHVFLVATNAARDGARIAAIGYDYSVVVSKVNQALGSWAGKTHVVEITPAEDQRRAGEPVAVQITVSVPLMTPILSNILSNPFPVRTTVTMRAE